MAGLGKSLHILSRWAFEEASKKTPCLLCLFVLPLKWHVLQFIFNLLSDVVRAATQVTYEVGTSGRKSWEGWLDPHWTQVLKSVQGQRLTSSAGRCLERRIPRKRKMYEDTHRAHLGKATFCAELGRSSGSRGRPSVEQRCPQAVAPRRSLPSSPSPPTGR